jgi:hypothetical protein
MPAIKVHAIAWVFALEMPPHFPPTFTGEVSRSDEGGLRRCNGPLHHFVAPLSRKRGRKIQLVKAVLIHAIIANDSRTFDKPDTRA